MELQSVLHVSSREESDLQQIMKQTSLSIDQKASKMRTSKIGSLSEQAVCKPTSAQEWNGLCHLYLREDEQNNH